MKTNRRAFSRLVLAHISHHLTAEARDRPAITSLRLLAVLTGCGDNRRGPA